MPPLYGIKAIMNYLELRAPNSFYDRVKIGLPVCKICGRIESSTELIDEWRTRIVKGFVKKDGKIIEKV